MIGLLTLAIVALPEPGPAIRRGDPVRIEYRRGGVLLTGSGRALAGGRIGQPVVVMRDGSRRALRALVRAPGLVEAAGSL